MFFSRLLLTVLLLCQLSNDAEIEVSFSACACKYRLSLGRNSDGSIFFFKINKRISLPLVTMGMMMTTMMMMM